MSAYISCRGWLALDVDSFRKLLQNCLPIKHLSHNRFRCIMDSRPFNIFFCAIIFKLSELICPSLTCQNQVSSFTHAFKHLGISVSMFSKNILFFIMITFAIMASWVSSNAKVQSFILISQPFSNIYPKLNILLIYIYI